jgi:CARDB protein
MSCFAHPATVLGLSRLIAALALSVGFAPVGEFWIAHAEHVPSHQPVLRLELVVDSIRIHDDADPTGSGEWRIGVVFSGSPGDGQAHRTFRNNNARSGTTWTLNEVVGPLSVFSGDAVRIDAAGVDNDGGFLNDDDYLGRVHNSFTEGERWGSGTHTQRSSTGNYSITYTIRPATLPDLRLTAMGPRPGQLLLADTPSQLCASYRNEGTVRAGEFSVDFLIDGEFEAREIRPFLNAGDVGITCADLTVSAGQHEVTVMLDAAFVIDESSETNNLRSARLGWGVLVEPDD